MDIIFSNTTHAYTGCEGCEGCVRKNKEWLFKNQAWHSISFMKTKLFRMEYRFIDFSLKYDKNQKPLQKLSPNLSLDDQMGLKGQISNNLNPMQR